MLDSVHGVDTASYQDNSITLAKLAQSLIAVLIPPGMIRMFGGPSIPSGWLACDGTAVSRTTYAALYAAIGTYWGVGDNISTFNLPDLRGRSPLGYVNSPISGITSRAFASNGGEENHVLNTNELASHAHSITDQQHSHGNSAHNHNYNDPSHYHIYHTAQNLTVASGSGASVVFHSAGQVDNAYTGINFDAQSIAIQNSFTGINGTNANGNNYGHNNMSPFAVMYFIIKT
jgi:microcystin-dependent protein